MNGYYCTMYRILDSSSKVLFKNTTASCYSDLFFGGVKIQNDFKSWVGKDNILEIFNPMSNLKGIEEIEDFWLHFLKSIGFEFKTSVIESLTEADKFTYPRQMFGVQNAPFRVWTLDLSTTPTTEHVKFACHIHRYIFEQYMHQDIERTMLYHKEHPEHTIWQCFLWSCMMQASIAGHAVVPRGVCRDLRLPDDVLISGMNDWIEGRNTGLQSTAILINKYSYKNNNMIMNIQNLGSKSGTPWNQIKTIEQYNKILNDLDTQKDGKITKTEDICSGKW